MIKQVDFRTLEDANETYVDVTMFTTVDSVITHLSDNP